LQNDILANWSIFNLDIVAKCDTSFNGNVTEGTGVKFEVRFGYGDYRTWAPNHFVPKYVNYHTQALNLSFVKYEPEFSNFTFGQVSVDSQSCQWTSMVEWFSPG
jgi:hypothetical protein